MSRRLPTRREIEKRAKEMHMSRSAIHGLPAITPEHAEVKESGNYHRARMDLMRSDEGAYSGQQRQYLETMAGEMGLKVIPKRELVFIKKETGFEWTNGWTKRQRRKAKAKPKAKPKPKPKKPIVPKIRAPKVSIRDQAVFLGTVHRVATEPKKKRKRRKSHTERTGKTMRKLRKIDGVKVFSFPDHVWKVRTKKRGKRRR